MIKRLNRRAQAETNWLVIAIAAGVFLVLFIIILIMAADKGEAAVELVGDSQTLLTTYCQGILNLPTAANSYCYSFYEMKVKNYDKYYVTCDYAKEAFALTFEGSEEIVCKDKNINISANTKCKVDIDSKDWAKALLNGKTCAVWINGEEAEVVEDEAGGIFLFV